MKRYLMPIVLSLSFLSGYCQTDSYGTEFWTGFLETGHTISSYRLYIHASLTTEVTVTIPLKSYTQKVKVLKDQTRIVYLPTSALQSPGDENIGKTGIHIVSDEPVTVNTVALETHSTVTTQVIPLVSINEGSTYISCNADPASFNKLFLVSADNGTSVEIKLTDSSTRGKKAFKPFTITLDAGETYQISAKKNCFEGTTIKVLNNKRIIAYSGDQNVNANIYGGCGHRQMTTNLLDVKWADKKYIVMPFFGQTKGYFIKLISLDSALNVKVNGKNYKIYKPDSALVLDVPKEDSVLVITADRKFACFEIMKGGGKNGFYHYTGAGHPSMVQVISPDNLTKSSSFLSLDSTNNVYHYMSVLIPKAGVSSTYFDGTVIPTNEFIAIPDDKDYMYAKLDISKGHHNITGSYGHLVYAYGLQHSSVAESYYYLAGFTFPNFNISAMDSVVNYDCKSGKIIVQFKAKLQGLLKSYHWDFGDGTTDTSRIVSHSFIQNKDYVVKFIGVGMDNKTDSVVKKYNFKWPEFNPVFDKIFCGADSFRFEEKNPFFTNFKWHDSATVNYHDATKTEKIWVKATDKTGYCKFSDSGTFTLFEAYSKVFVDTLSNCHLNNLFNFRDSSDFKGDSIRLKVWSFPGGFNLYDTTNFKYHFRQPGKYMVYFDIYPATVPCKARVEIPITVNWNTDIDAATDKEKYCNGEWAIIKDNSYSCCQKVKNYYWEVEGSPKMKSDSGVLKTQVYFDYKNENPIRNYFYITETEQGCRDTIKYGVLAMPAAKSGFDMGKDSVKCLVLSRWTFTHTPDEHITGPYTIFWNFGNGKTGTVNQYKNFRYSDTGTYAIKLTTTTSIGCLDSTVKQVKVIGNPIVKFEIADSVQCLANNNFVITDSSKGYDLLYTWNMGNGLGGNTKTPAPVHYDTAGKYVIKLKAISNYPGCFADSVIHKAEVLKPPKAGFVISNDTQCFKNSSVLLTDNSKFFNGKFKLYWHYNATLDSAFIPKAIHYADTGNHLIMLVVKDSMNCVDTVSETISIKPEPVLKMSINDTVQCFGVNNFSVQSLQSLTMKTRIWTFNNALISGEELQKDIANIGPEGFYKITLIEETPFGCKDSISRWVEVLPAAKAGFTSNLDTQCFGKQSYYFRNLSVTKDKIKSFIYEENKNTIGNTADIANYKFGSFGSKTVQLKIISENNCIDSISHSVYLVEEPVVSFESDSVCLGDTVYFKPVQISGKPVNRWAWNPGDGSAETAGPIQPFDYTYQNFGTFIPTLNVTDIYNCVGSFNGNPVLVYPLPTAGFNFKVLASDDKFSFVKLNPGNLGYASYLWSFPDGSKNYEDTPTIKFSKFFKDYISLKVRNIYGCSDSSSQFLYIFPKLTDLYFENAFTPNGDLLNEAFRPYNIDGAENYELRIYNRWGEQLFKTNDPKAGWNGTYKNEPAQLGVYIFTVEFMYADGNRYSTKGNVTVVR